MPQGPLAAAVGRTFQKALNFVQLDQQFALWSSNRHGKYYGATYGTAAITSPATAAKAGSTFRGSNSSSVALSAALATTYTGLCLSNPAGSTVNLVVHKVAAVVTAAPSAFVGLGLITGWAAAGVTVHTTPINTNIVNGYVGAAASGGSIVAAAPAANLDAACTLVGTPAWDRWIVGNIVTANPISFYVNLDDDLIVPPGAYVAIGASAAIGSGVFGSFSWEELPP
jgi:hypothetical protein